MGWSLFAFYFQQTIFADAMPVSGTEKAPDSHESGAFILVEISGIEPLTS